VEEGNTTTAAPIPSGGGLHDDNIGGVAMAPPGDQYPRGVVGAGEHSWELEALGGSSWILREDTEL
jgi:hypothetical protein